MKRILFILLCWAAANCTFAQKGTRFIDNGPWENVLQQAKQANKAIFVDCYTSWCGPCKKLATEIFPQEKVGNFMNKTFINVKYDVEKGEGLKFNEQYPGQVKAYPTMLIIRPNGEIIHKILGYMPADELLKAVEDGLQGNTIYTMAKEYAAGNREAGFIKEYLQALDYAGEKETHEKLVRQYAAQFPIDSLFNREIWDLMKRYIVQAPYSKEYRFVVEHLDEFQKRGIDRYALEDELASSMGFEVNMLLLGALQPNAQDSLSRLHEKAEQLRPLLKYPVKGFAASLAELSTEICWFSGDTDKLYARFVNLMDCGFITRPVFQTSILEYLVHQLHDVPRLQQCIDYLLAMQKENHSWLKESIDTILAEANYKLKQTKSE